MTPSIRQLNNLQNSVSVFWGETSTPNIRVIKKKKRLRNKADEGLKASMWRQYDEIRSRLSFPGCDHPSMGGVFALPDTIFGWVLWVTEHPHEHHFLGFSTGTLFCDHDWSYSPWTGRRFHLCRGRSAYWFLANGEGNMREPLLFWSLTITAPKYGHENKRLCRFWIIFVAVQARPEPSETPAVSRPVASERRIDGWTCFYEVQMDSEGKKTGLTATDVCF